MNEIENQVRKRVRKQLEEMQAAEMDQPSSRMQDIIKEQGDTSVRDKLDMKMHQASEATTGLETEEESKVEEPEEPIVKEDDGQSEAEK